jgi:O-antigen ligase
MSKPTSLASIWLLLGALLLFACWMAPNHFYPWVSFQNEFLAGLAGLMFVAAALFTREVPAAWPRASSVVAAVSLIPAAQYFAGQIAFRSDALLSFLYLASLGLAVSAGATLARADLRKFLDAVFGALLAAAIASAGMALSQWLGLDLSQNIEWMPPGARAIANIAQPNHLAALLALGVLGALWLYETGRIGGRTLWLVALWLALGMAFTRTRMVWVATALFIVGWFWLGARTRVRLPRHQLLAWAVAFATIVAAIGPISNAIDARAPESLGDRLQGGGGRLRIWAAVIEGLIQSPWVGYGWSQVSRAGLAGSTHHFTGEAMLRQSHSVPLDLLVWNGIPLGLLLIGVIAMWCWRQVRRCDNVEQGVTLAAVGLLVFYSLLEFPLESFYFLIPFGLLVGALEVWSPETPLPRVPRLALAVVLAGVTALGAAVAMEYPSVEDASRQGRMLEAGFVSNALLPKPVLLDEPIEYIRFWRTHARAGMSPAELNWMRRIAGRNPAPPTLLRYATASGLNGQPEVAARTLVQLCNLHAPSRCDEGRKSWAKLQQNFQVLQPIPYPLTPTAP